MFEIRDTQQRRIHKKTILLTVILLAWFLVIVGRLVDLQVIHHPEFRTEVLNQNSHTSEIIPRRGGIYDRNGTTLAVSLPVFSVAYVPFKGDSPKKHLAQINLLQKVLSLAERDVQRILARIEDKDTFVWIKRKISDEEHEKLIRLNLAGISFREENKRFYPLGRLAAHVLGGVGMDDKGLSGVEQKYDELLKGVSGESLILQDARKRKYQIEVLKEPQPGKDLILTIDQTIQHIAERELRRAIDETQANWGTVVISNPASGEILAMASFPTYDPNVYPGVDREADINRAVRYNFEPGSTFKIITVSAALELGTSRLSDTFDCREGKIRIGGWTVWDHEKFGILTFPAVFIHSSNVGTIKISQSIPQDRFYNAVQAFGFGKKTEVGLPGEENGIFHSLTKWTKASLPSISIGYGISVTAIQVLQALNVIANRGILVPPRIIKEKLQAGVPAVRAPRVISERTAAEVTEILEAATEEGTGKEALLEGFPIAGKTGTAQKLDPALGGYSAKKHLSAFAGFVPADKPVLSIVIILDEPKGTLYYGGQVAAPVFRDIARSVLLYLHEPPRVRPKPEPVITAQLQGRRKP